ncbi:diguanylate cyclase (GGDEF)-like protein [Bacillus thermophilus]|uniref:Diguanylate cyclase (GGDEF)-like protein n=1 Tax=Siminovitchia thermophila TaxID=1245522 RepID=A0ABS2R1D6_9BACI|nr:sensor domain-containing diguanylate cyclase [Siminovitchia thermophila]MBM7713455.1 diguanylate cyclase (GGDEF)-like protein [Siminovitchia thermophila]
MNTRKKIITWALWLMIVPICHWYAYQISPPQYVGFWDIFAFSVTAVIIACIPLTVNKTVVFLTQWISIAVFLSYGMFYEMVLLQLATVVSMLAIKDQSQKFYRYLLYSSMFTCISFISGIGFFAAGGEVGYDSSHNAVFPIATYVILSFSSALLLRGLLRFFTNVKSTLFGSGLLWDICLRLVVYPLGIGLFYLNNIIGPAAFALIGIPVLSSLLVLKMYQSSLRVNLHLQTAAEIGHQLAERLNVEEVLNLFMKKITKTFPVEWAYILGLKGDMLVVVRQYEKDSDILNMIPPIPKDKGICGIVLKREKGLIYGEKSEWRKFSHGYSPNHAESVICVPIMQAKQIEGVLFLASSRKNAFHKFQLMIVDIMCSYLAVALSNARHYEETKRESEYCPMTKIPNFRYFDKYIYEKFKDLQDKKIECISLIIVDIDHFKTINDQYGHQAGDQILITLADRLQALVAVRGVLARYGGEEFVILLPDTDDKEAHELAETVRQAIANHPFLVHNELDPARNIVEVSITASIGVSTAPKHANDPVSLVKYADRALYIGAKRAGRNRVAKYVQGEKETD